MIEEQPGNDWKDLQSRVAKILEECGLVTEAEKTIILARGKAEVDVYAIDSSTTPESVYICECKRWASRVPQGEVQTFRTIVSDAGAHFGLFISAGGFQAGTYDVVQYTNIHLLDWMAFQQLFLERWCTSFWIPTVRSKADALAGHTEMPGNDAPIRFANGEPITAAEAVGFIVHDMWGAPFNNIANALLGKPAAPVSAALWECRNKYLNYLPAEIANAKYLRELMDVILRFSDLWIKDRHS